jgi:hypothetical protein
VPGTAVISISSESGKSIPEGIQLSSNGTRNQQFLTGWMASPIRTHIPGRIELSVFPTLCRSSIQTSNYSAAQRNNAGAVVNVITRHRRRLRHDYEHEFSRRLAPGSFNSA